MKVSACVLLSLLQFFSCYVSDTEHLVTPWCLFAKAGIHAQLFHLSASPDPQQAGKHLLVDGGELRGSERSSHLPASHTLSPKLPPLSLLLAHPYFHSYSQIRAVMVNECIFPFLLQHHPVTYCTFPVIRKAKSERQIGGH